MDARATIESYYDALRDGPPLDPYFAGRREDGDDETVKFGISERLVDIEAIEAGLREQTRTTADWAVDSRSLRVTERDRVAWFSDDVFLAWTDTGRGIRFEFETRWSGTLERRPEGGGGGRIEEGGGVGSGGNGGAGPGEDDGADPGEDDGVGPGEDDGAGPGEGDGERSDWRFVGMHVSTADEL